MTVVRERQWIDTRSGRIAYLEAGVGDVALFVHGALLSGELWSPLLERAGRVRRCLCPDLLAHGWTEEVPDADLSFAGQARMLSDFIDALEVQQFDLVGNDSGGGIAQILAARHPERIRSLTLTNCDVHDGWPPPLFQPVVTQVTGPEGPALIRALGNDLQAARTAFAMGFEAPEELTDAELRALLGPPPDRPDRVDHVVRFFASFDCADTVAVKPALEALTAPVLIVWAGADRLFDLRWAHWLRDTLPNVSRVVEFPRAKLFFPYERAEEFAAELRLHWNAA